ncbi:MAG: hypothetical protein Q7V63_06615 [Gammaproteobacteria bacterium]|nr:hypothetical protein [Gammaproteobacteria bacterium]
MTNSTIKVLSELSKDDQKALLLELPQGDLGGLTIYPDGTVDTQQLLQYLMKISKKDQAIVDDGLTLHEEIELMLNIYDSSRAINNTSQKTNT